MEFVVSALLGAVLGWAANHFLPGLWRRITRKPVINMFVETDPSIIWAGAPPWVGARYVVPDVRDLGVPPSDLCTDWYAWLKDRGGVSAEVTEAEITLTAATDVTVVIDGVRARIVRRDKPPGWTHLLCGVGGADITPRHIRIELEGFDTPTTTFLDQSGQRVNWPRLSLSKGEAEKLYVTARAHRYDIEWTAELLTIVDGKRRIFPIDDNGRPFRTCGTEGLPTHTWYGPRHGQWDPPLV